MIDVFNAPVPRADMDLDGNISLRTYAFYLKNWCPDGTTPMFRVTHKAQRPSIEEQPNCSSPGHR
jgi:hypothetical protein